MTLDEATALVRKVYPHRLIWSAAEYKDYYVFMLAINETYIPFDLALTGYRVEKKDGKIRVNPRPRISDPIQQPIRRVLIDITEEQDEAIE